MKIFYTFILISLASSVFGQSLLPKCPRQCEFGGKLYNCADQRKLCYGPVIDEPQGDFYEGEWIDGALNGQGVKVLQNGNIQIGQWQYGALNGLGIIYSKNKKILAEGLWDYDKLIETKKLDPSKFTNIDRSTLERLNIVYPNVKCTIA